MFASPVVGLASGTLYNACALADKSSERQDVAHFPDFFGATLDLTWPSIAITTHGSFQELTFMRTSHRDSVL